MRAFVAIELPDEAQRALAELQRPLAQVEGLKLVRPEQCHLTLKFLGEIDERRRAEFAAALGGIRLPPFELELTEAGAFPNARRPRVVWIGVAVSAELLALARAVDGATAAIALDKPFQAHITLARAARDGRRIALPDPGRPAPCRFQVPGFVLFQSAISSAGAVHTPLERFGLLR